MDERKADYIDQLEHLGFYVDGRPAAGTLAAGVNERTR